MKTVVRVELERGLVAGGSVRDAVERLRDGDATWIDVVDVDAARGHAHQWRHLQAFLDQGLSVQWSGGLRRMTQIQQLIELGASRVGLGTHAANHPDWLKEAVTVFPRRIAVHLDVQDGRVLVEGRSKVGPDSGILRTLAPLAACVVMRYVGPGSPEPRGLVRDSAPTPLWLDAPASAAERAAWQDAGISAQVVDLAATGWESELASRPGPDPARRLTVEDE